MGRPGLSAAAYGHGLSDGKRTIVRPACVCCGMVQVFYPSRLCLQRRSAWRMLLFWLSKHVQPRESPMQIKESVCDEGGEDRSRSKYAARAFKVQYSLECISCVVGRLYRHHRDSIAS